MVPGISTPSIVAYFTHLQEFGCEDACAEERAERFSTRQEQLAMLAFGRFPKIQGERLTTVFDIDFCAHNEL